MDHGAPNNISIGTLSGDILTICVIKAYRETKWHHGVVLNVLSLWSWAVLACLMQVKDVGGIGGDGAGLRDSVRLLRVRDRMSEAAGCSSDLIIYTEWYIQLQ